MAIDPKKGYTYEELIQMGATPVQQPTQQSPIESKGYTLKQLQKKTGPTTNFSNVGSKLKQDFTQRRADLQKLNQSDYSTGTKVLGNIGHVAGGAGDIINRGLGLATPEFIEKPLVKGVESGVGKVAQSGTGQKISEWAKTHPEAAQNLNSIVNIAGIIPEAKAVELGAKAAQKTVKTGAKLAAKQGEKRAAGSLEKIAIETADPLNKKSSIEALKQTGRTTKEGKELGVKSKGLAGKYEVQQSNRDLERAKTVAPYVKPGKPLSSIKRLNTAIDEIAENEVLPNLRNNPRAFNLKTLKAKMESKELPLTVQADPLLEKTYSTVRNKMLQIAEGHPKTMEGLWNARKEFDALIKREFGTLAFEDPKRSIVRRALQDVRRDVNDYISDEIGDGAFKQNMKKLSHIFESVDNIAESNYKLINSDRVQRLLKKYPKTFKALGLFTAGGVGYGLLE